MIPKIIHYCWLSDDDYPQNIKNNIQNWKSMLPEYEFILWDSNRFNVSQSLWTQQAFENKKYAFAADFIRLYALHIYGGIYLDTDVEILKKFDNLLHLPYFIGSQYDKLIEAAIIGSEKNSSWILKCLQYYNDRPFIKENGILDTLELPLVMQSQLEGFKNILIMEDSQVEKVKSLLKDNDTLYLFPFEYFSAKNYESGKISETKNTYTIHYFNSNWLPFFSKFRRKLKQVIGDNRTEKIISFFKVKKLLKFLYLLEKKWDSK